MSACCMLGGPKFRLPLQNCTYVKEDRFISAGASRISIDSTWFHIPRLSSIQPHRVHPSASARTVGVRLCISVASVSYARVVCPLHARHSSCRPVMYARLGHRLTTFIGPWPCAASPPVGLIPRYRLDEFMSEVISIFPCSKPLSGGSQAHWSVLESHMFSFFSFFFIYLLMAR
jgi:hypothetical protein